MDPIYTNYWYYTYFPTLLGMTSFQPVTPQFPVFPVYGFYYNPTGVESAYTVSNLTNLVNDVEGTLQPFLGTDNVFNERTLEISTNAVTGTVEEGAPIETYEISISQLATNQVNTGNWLNTGTLDFTTGTQEFSITIGGNTYNFTVDVLSSDTNLSVLDKIAEAINEAGIGVSANVEISGDQARIVLEGQNTGENASFSVSDVTGSLVNVSGMGNVTQNAQNLVYTVNGVTGESEENVIELEGVTLNVNELPEETFTVEVNYNTEEIRNALENLVSSLNELSSFVEENSAYLSPGIEALVNSVVNNLTLENIGVENVNGQLEVGENLEDLLENPKMVESLVQPVVEGFVESTQSALNSILTLSSYQILSPNLQNVPTYNTYSLINSYVNNLLLYYSTTFNYFA